MMTFETKQDELWSKLVPLRVFNSHQVREIGFAMFYDRADRTCRDWAMEGKLRRIPLDECILRGLVLKGRAPLAHWEIV